jgi:hypothetical protein
MNIGGHEEVKAFIPIANLSAYTPLSHRRLRGGKNLEMMT